MVSPRSLRPLLLLILLVLGASLLTRGAPAEAEEGGRTRLLIFPLRGAGGAIARDAIAERIGDQAATKRLGSADAQSPARAARRHKADAMITGGIRCPGAVCQVEVVIYRRSGQVWSKASDRAKRPEVGTVAADLAEKQLADLGLLGGGGSSDEVGSDGGTEMIFSEPAEESGPEKQPAAEVSEDDFDFGNYGDDGDGGKRRKTSRRSRYRVNRRYKALEVEVNFDVTVGRLLCLDLAPELENDDECSMWQPSDDDRTYQAAPFTNMGFRAVVFPGAFFNRRAWWSQIGLYVDYGHSLILGTSRDYRRQNIPTAEEPNPPAEEFTQTIDTSQQDLRVGVIGRIPLGGPDRPQLRVRGGVGYYEYFLDDQDYPPSVNEAEGWRLTERHKRTNPYLPAISYSTFDIGVELRLTYLGGKLLPYTALAYQIGTGTGQMEEVLATSSLIQGVDWELGLHVELPFGIRLTGAFELLWYGVTYSGEAPELPPGHLWGATSPAERSRDTILRFRVGAGWAF